MSEYRKMKDRHCCPECEKNGVYYRRIGSNPWHMLASFSAQGSATVLRIDGPKYCSFCGEKLEDEQ